MEKPEVSVVMAVYNERPFLKKAVQSILDQTFEDFEFIILNDGSTDGSKAALEEFAGRDDRIRLVHQTNKGLIASLNRGLEIASGKYIARMDGDDISHPERFGRQVSFLEENSEVGILGTWVEIIDETGSLDRQWRLPTNPDAVAWQSLFNYRLCHPAIMARQSVLKSLGGYAEWATCAEDYELWSRALFKTRIVNLPDALHKHRVHQDAITVKDRAEQIETVIDAAVIAHRSLLGTCTNEQLSRFLLWMDIIGIERAIEETGLEDFPAAFEYVCSLYQAFTRQVARGRGSIEPRQNALPKLDKISREIGKKEGRLEEMKYRLRARTMPPTYEVIPWLYKAIQRRVVR